MVKQPKAKLNVLFLARWYPNRFDPMPGLFVQRHAEAVSRFCHVGVVFVQATDEKSSSRYEIDFSVEKEVATAKVYYHNPDKKYFLFSSILKIFRFYKANYLGIQLINKELGDFDLIHVHILTRLGMIALFYKWIYKIPFVITEHWSRYLPLTNNFKGIWRKLFTKLIVKNAAAVTTVTQNLASAMQAHGLNNRNYSILPNVVDDNFYQSKSEKKLSYEKTIVHVSCFEDKSKNISGILRVIKSLSSKRNDFIFKMIGVGIDFQKTTNYANELGLDQKKVVFAGLLEGKRLVNEMSTADMMVVFSNYENFPVVINESFVLGIPVLATSVGGIPEYVNQKNGRLLKAGDEQSLEKNLVEFLDNRLTFNSEEISGNARESFSPQKIGNILFELYQNSVKK